MFTHKLWFHNLLGWSNKKGYTVAIELCLRYYTMPSLKLLLYRFAVVYGGNYNIGLQGDLSI